MVLRYYFLLSILIPFQGLAQFTYVMDQSIPVEVEGRMLAMPWSGGLNSAQINSMDLNNDGIKDLVIFDRSTNKVSTFLSKENQYTYHPEFEILFPAAVNKWMLLRDYNCDGKEDIFTPSNNGIVVYKNITEAGGLLSWEKLNFYVPPIACAPSGTQGLFTEILLTTTSIITTTCPGGAIVTRPNQTNIFPGTNDIPSITDMDGDGDLDILHMRFVSPGTVQYHKNMSMENYGTCDSLAFQRIDQRWGDFEECSCGKFSFSGSCPPDGGRTNHNVGKALMAIDVNGDGNKDVFFSEEDCPALFYLKNDGSTDLADMNSAIFFPQAKPILMPLYPVTYFEDVDFDGVPDLLASPAVYARTALNNPFTNSIWYYKNTGTKQAPNFTYIKNNFLQDEMVEVGDYAYPAFVDADGDGDEDLFIGNYGDDQFRGVIAFYENVGSSSAAAFKLVTKDYLNLSLLSLYNMKPQFIDINSDGNMDITFLVSDPTNGTAILLYVPGNNPNALNFGNQEVKSANFEVPNRENLLLEDIDQDGLVDILLGKSSGELEYWRNTGPAGAFNFTLENQAFMGLSSSLSRSNLNASVADMDHDGREDLIIGDQSGYISIYGDFRSTMNSPQPAVSIIYDVFSQGYSAKSFGAKIKPVAVNLFNSNRPAIAIGSVGGGMFILKNDGGEQLPAEPEITIYPNPLIPGEKLSALADRNMLMQLFTIMGQKISEPVFVGGNQPTSVGIAGLSSGIYIARFTNSGKTYSRKFVIH